MQKNMKNLSLPDLLIPKIKRKNSKDSASRSLKKETLTVKRRFIKNNLFDMDSRATSRGGMRRSQMFRTTEHCQTSSETKTQRTFNTSSVVSFADSTSASTLFNNFQKKESKESHEDLEENIWNYEAKRMSTKELFVGTEAFLDYYK